MPTLPKACLKEGNEHGENHPNVNPLDIGGGQDRLGDPDEAELSLLFISQHVCGENAESENCCELTMRQEQVVR